jgi:uncharacterized membrane protein YfcA
MHIFILLLAGFAGGIINAIAGGGGILMFPALLSVGLSPLAANATSSFVVWPGTLSAIYVYRKELAKIPRYYALLFIPAAIGAIVGARALLHTPGATFEKIVPWLVLFAVFMLAVQPAVHRRIEARAGRKFRRHPLRVIGVIGLVMLPLATYGGYFGVGYGIMILAFLGYTNLHTIHQMNGVKNLTGATIAIISTVFFLRAGLIDWSAGLPMAAGTIMGGAVGGHLALRASGKLVHDATVVIGTIIALILLFQAYR